MSNEQKLPAIAMAHHQRASSRGSPIAKIACDPPTHTIDIADRHTQATECHLSPANRNALVARYYAELGGEDGPKFFTYANYLCYLYRTSTTYDGIVFIDSFASVSKELLRLAGGDVYLADGMAFVREVLFEEFPEFSLFRLPLADAFVESCVHPGIFIESRRFADLHLLSRMRRELKHTGVAVDKRAIDVVGILLGLENGSKGAL